MSSVFTFNYFGSAITAQSLDVSTIPPTNKILSAHCVPITDEGKIVAIDIIDRGVDIPGGHLEAGETPEAAMARETYEEAFITVGTPTLIDIWQLSSENEALGLTEKPYLVVYVAKVKQIDEFLATGNEASSRLLLTPDEFISKYFGNKDQVKTMIAKAMQIVKL